MTTSLHQTLNEGTNAELTWVYQGVFYDYGDTQEGTTITVHIPFGPIIWAGLQNDVTNLVTAFLDDLADLKPGGTSSTRNRTSATTSSF